MFDESPQLCSLCDSEMHKIYITAAQGYMSEPRTLGAIADKNANIYSDEQKEEMNRQHKRDRGDKKKESGPRWYNKYCTKTNKEVQQMSPKRRKQYIEEGI